MAYEFDEEMSANMGLIFSAEDGRSAITNNGKKKIINMHYELLFI